MLSYNQIIKIFFTISVCVFSSGLTAQADNLLVNGSFEEGPPAGSYRTLQEGDRIPGWLVSKATVDLNGTYFKSYDGNQSLDLHGTPGYGSIEQSFFTKKGKRYKLTFYMAGNPVGNPQIKKMQVSAGNNSMNYEFDIKGKTTSKMGWEKREMIFKATQRKTILEFRSLHNSGSANYGPAIDYVSVKTYRGSFMTPSSDAFFGFRFGILGGASYYFINKEEFITLSINNIPQYRINIDNADYGIHFGFFTQFNVRALLLRPALIFNSNVINYKVEDLRPPTTNTIAVERYQYIDIPLMLGYKTNIIRVMAGPVGHLFIGSQSELLEYGNFSFDYKPFSIGYQLGLGLDIHRVALDLRYEGNFNKFGDGILFAGERIYFSNTPGRLIATLSFTIK